MAENINLSQVPGATNDPNLLQAYVLLDTRQLKSIGELFDAHDRESIAKSITRIIDEYIEEHTKQDVAETDKKNTWRQFETMFNEGRFNK